jgi:hypothetical protein
VKTKKETIFSAQLDGLENGRVSEVIACVADSVLQTPISRSSVICSNCFVECSAIINIWFEDYFSALQMLGEWHVHGAQF